MLCSRSLRLLRMRQRTWRTSPLLWWCWWPAGRREPERRGPLALDPRPAGVLGHDRPSGANAEITTLSPRRGSEPGGPRSSPAWRGELDRHRALPSAGNAQACGCCVIRGGRVGVGGVHEIEQGPHCMLRPPLIGPDHDLWSEDVDPAALFGHPGRDHPLKITNREQITTVIPLIARDQCSRRRL